MMGTFLFTKYTLPGMIERRSGQIINIASVAGINGFKGGSAYSSAKFAVMGFTESVREDVKEFGIAVSAVCLGLVRTGFGGNDPDTFRAE
jgi:short-subunit dehydrogenase